MRLNRKKLIRLVIVVVLVLVLLEVGTRVIVAFKTGSSALLYGTRFEGSAMKRGIVRPKDAPVLRWDKLASMEDPDKVLKEHEQESYSKYPPNIKKNNVDQFGNEITIAINSHGFRGRDFEQRKEEGVIRVIMLGASSTFGYHDGDTETYPYYLEHYLNDALQIEGAPEIKSFEVINFGVPHLNSANIYALFVSEALDLNPDVVTFYEGINDTRQVRPYAHQRLLFSLATKSMFFRFIKYVYLTRFDFGAFSECDFKHHLAGKSERFIRYVSLIAEECKKRDIVFIVASQQAKSNSIEREKMNEITFAEEVDMVERKLSRGERIDFNELLFLIHADIMDELRAWCSDTGVTFVDIIKAFDEQRSRDCLVSWVHISPQGNRLIASEFGKEILEQYGYGAAD
jgi:lysophospholipase L1-like esterase